MSSVVASTLSNLTSTASATSATASTGKKTSLDMEDFLTLLTSEMKYQDPLNPTDNSEMIQQTAAFSQISALNDMATSMENLSDYALSINNMQAVSFLGKTVSSAGNAVEYTGSPVDLNFTSADDAAAFTVKIYDSSGAEVRTVNMDGAEAGNQSYAWDGANDDGQAVTEGDYTYRVSALDSNGKAVSTTTFTKGTVSNVRYENGSTYLTVGDDEITLSEVLKIYQ